MRVGVAAPGRGGGVADGPFPRPQVVIKVGTSSLIHQDGQRIALRQLASVVETVGTLRRAGHEVLLVSSGAVGFGCLQLGIAAKPKDVASLQALAALGQARLMRQYTDMFAAIGLRCAQVLLTYGNLANRREVRGAAAPARAVPLTPGPPAAAVHQHAHDAGDAAAHGHRAGGERERHRGAAGAARGRQRHAGRQGSQRLRLRLAVPADRRGRGVHGQPGGARPALSPARALAP